MRATIFLIVLLICRTNIFGQSDGDELICRITGDDCRKRTEIIEIVKNINKRIADDKKLGVDTEQAEYFTLGVEYFYLDDYADALSHLNKIEPYYLTSDTLTYRGLIYLRQGKNDEALKAFNSVIDRKIDYAAAYYGRAEIYRQRRKYDDAIKDYDRALEKNFRFSKAYFGRAIAYFKRGEPARLNKNEISVASDYKNALKDLNTVMEIDLDRTSREVYLYCAKIYEALGDETKAKEDYRKYKEIVNN